MGSDSANFRELEIQAVYNGNMNRTCFLTSQPSFQRMPVDPMHILGKGFAFGVKPEHDQRKMFSSVFNLAWGRRDFHSGAVRDTNEMRHLLLRLAYEKVMFAVTQDRYQLSKRDKDFLEFAEQWKSANPV